MTSENSQMANSQESTGSQRELDEWRGVKAIDGMNYDSINASRPLRFVEDDDPTAML